MSKINKKFFKPVYFQAIAFTVIYILVSLFVVGKSLLYPNVYIALLISFIFGLVSTSAFLYFFSHEDFFHFFRGLEKLEDKAEKSYLGRYLRYGKLLACISISLAGGPIFLALTIRFLFPKSKNKFMIAFISVLISTIIVIFFGKGLLSIVGFRI